VESWINARDGASENQPMLDFRWVVKNRKIQPEAAFFPTKNQGLEWMNSNPRMQIAIKNRGKESSRLFYFIITI
jgi:hypothetical protein